MTLRIAAASAFVAATVVAAAWFLHWPVERAVYLAPAFVLGTGLVAGVALLLGRALLESLRASRNPRLVLILWAVALALIALLSVLGVELPREG